MHPAVPDEPADGGGAGPSASGASADDIGRFEQGSPLSRWALSRYLVGRAIGESIGTSLYLIALAILALAAAAEWGLRSTFAAVVLAVLAAMVLLLRAGLRAVLRRLTAVDRYGPVEARLRALVSDTRADVRTELRRLGLPSHRLTLPLLGWRLLGRRRAETLARLRGFEVDRAVPAARLDELHMLLRHLQGGAGRG